ncbi:MAG: endolytic transglycosylase MltG [Candidatus Acidiferrales bacterium]
MRRAFWTLIFLAIVGGAAWLAAAWYLPYQGFASPPGAYVDIPHGASRRTIGRLLADQGVIRSRLAFEVLARFRDPRPLEAGEYYFDHAQTQHQVFDAIASGHVYVISLVVPEGYNMFDIADLAQQEGLVTRDEFLAAAADPAAIQDLAPSAPNLEGFLFPATYEFGRHVTAAEMVKAMVKKFREEWATLPQPESARPPVAVEHVVTLASLVERETPLDAERPLVAGVFTNRLARRMPLECDPTVAYALALAGRSTGPLNDADLHFKSPYNTYEVVGLPPGPISNPGEASLRAALDPPPTDYLYFVANAQGGHFFSKTLAEHNRNVARYRKLRSEEQQSAPTENSHAAHPSPRPN